MHYYQFNIGEYASHTRHLSPIEDIAYRRLLDLAYTSELPIPKDLHQVTRLINLREYKQEVEDVLREFFFESDDGWLNNRVIKEIEKTGRKSEAAKNSAAVRWDNERKAKKMQQQCHIDANALNNNAIESKNGATNNPIPNTQYQEPITQYPIPNTKNPVALAIAKETNYFSAQKNTAPQKIKNSETELQSACKQTWKSYADEYFERYHVTPIRNAKVNATVKNFVQRIGFEESPHVAAHYVTSNNSYYVGRGHSFDCLLADAEKLRTEWATGMTMTRTRASQIDKTQSNKSAVGEAMAILGE